LGFVLENQFKLIQKSLFEIVMELRMVNGGGCLMMFNGFAERETESCNLHEVKILENFFFSPDEHCHADDQIIATGATGPIGHVSEFKVPQVP